MDEREENERKALTIRGFSFPVDVAVLFLLVFLVLPSEGLLEFGKELGDLAGASEGFARLFERSLVRNPVAAVKTSLAAALLALYSLVSFRVLFRGGRRARGVLLALLVLLLVLLPAAAEIGLRFEAGNRGHAHDGGVVQTEEAARFLLRGENPYAADYRSTPMAGLEWGPGNPAIIHLPYFPLSFLVHAPFLVIGERISGAYDARVLYLLFYLATFFLVVRWSADPERKLVLAALWGLNPFLVPHLVQGRNDVVVAAMLVAAVHLLLSRRAAASVLLLGAACATKQFAFLFVPFFVVSLGAAPGRGWTETLRAGARKALPGLVPLLVLVLPFLLWDAGAFLDDTWAFNVGLAEVSYPLGGTPGFGLGYLLAALGVVPSVYHYFPFAILQIPVLLPLGWVLLRRHRADGTPASLLVSFSLFLFVFLFLSRVFHHNYLALIFFFLAAPVFGERLRTPEEE
ncbi:MAG: hypothetical protein ABIH26_02930 [Candidatus Eisenbacteria bacterium]